MQIDNSNSRGENSLDTYRIYATKELAAGNELTDRGGETSIACRM